jgi:hypothetical protein
MLVERKEVLNEDKSIGYIEAVFNSDNILKTTYFPQAQRLYIAFSRGHTYSYGSISKELYDEFENADSQGKFFHKNINNKIKHPTRKEFTLYPKEIQDLKETVKTKMSQFEKDQIAEDENGEDY